MSNVLNGQQAINSLNFDLGKQTAAAQADSAQVNTQANTQVNAEAAKAGLKPEAKQALKAELLGQKDISQAEQALLQGNDSDTAKPKMNSEQLEVVAQKLQEFVSEMNRGLEFLVDEDSGRDVIKVIDKNTGDLVKQFPSEDVLELVAHLSEATGNFIDSKI
ncbi:flagellar protein FlaG [Thalassomonas haliotis]|uniref:Flagellar protein FlaG n=1 Tax=Thalassomonas haliotis TaxID=485448 RepID=A0ABY7VKP1_9GAMM|nr:flagellar protein FlaG [Thalassomonas haliotis]WDE13227.1 flagellar protein FlaG [Thalassomonas haliotis]